MLHRRIIIIIFLIRLLYLNLATKIFRSYIYINQTDPDSTLTWLISELMDSEAKGEKVIFIFLLLNALTLVDFDICY